MIAVRLSLILLLLSAAGASGCNPTATKGEDPPTESYPELKLANRITKTIAEYRDVGLCVRSFEVTSGTVTVVFTEATGMLVIRASATGPGMPSTSQPLSDGSRSASTQQSQPSATTPPPPAPAPATTPPASQATAPTPSQSPEIPPRTDARAAHP